MRRLGYIKAALVAPTDDAGPTFRIRFSLGARAADVIRPVASECAALVDVETIAGFIGPTNNPLTLRCKSIKVDDSHHRLEGASP